MASYVNYMQVGKDVFITGIAGLAAGYVHFQFLGPRFVGQTIMGINVLTIVDFIVAFIIGIATTMYTSNAMYRMVGYGLAGTLFAVGLMSQFGIIAGGVPAARLSPTRTGLNSIPFSPAVPRASYLAAPGVIVNKHGTVPEIAAGTFG